MNPEPGHVYEGHLVATGLRVGIVCARFNELFVKNLLAGALDTLARHGAAAQDVRVAWVPGSYELPFIVRQLAASGTCDALIALGMVIQGATPHAQFINSQVAANLAAVAHETGIPVIYGVVTAENLEQATERSGTKHGNRGASAAAAAIEMANLLKAIRASQPPAGDR